MGVIENLGKLPSPLSSYERKTFEQSFKEGSIFPQGKGFFASDGRFIFMATKVEASIPGFPNLEKTKTLWGAPLLKYDSDNHRLNITPEGLIQVVRKNDLETAVGIVTLGNVRQYRAFESGQTIVSEGGLVFPPTNNGKYRIGFNILSGNELLEEIQKGEKSELFGSSGQSFECVLDPTLIGKSVTLLNLESHFGKQDTVIIDENNNLLERNRFYPFKPQSDVDRFYRDFDRYFR